MSEPYYPVDRLSALLQWVRKFPHQARFERFGAKLDKRTPFHQIQYCSQALLAGALPDAETLEFVAIAFQRYVDAEGGLSLDESFKLKSKPKAGNPSRRYARNQKILKPLYWMAMYRAHNPKLSIPKAAEAAMQHDESIPVETLEREYKRRGLDKWAEQIRGK